jgi:hypothetical protein
MESIPSRSFWTKYAKVLYTILLILDLGLLCSCCYLLGSIRGDHRWLLSKATSYVQRFSALAALVKAWFTLDVLTAAVYALATTTVAAWVRQVCLAIWPAKYVVPASIAIGSSFESVIDGDRKFGPAPSGVAGVLFTWRDGAYRPLGTAWRLSANVLVTAGHVLSRLDDNESLYMGVVDDKGQASPLEIAGRFDHARVHFVPACDLVFIKHHSINKVASRLKLKVLRPSGAWNISASVVGYHPEHKKMLRSPIGYVRCKGGDYTHTCNTVGGMSGGPLLAGTRVVGVHTGGDGRQPPEHNYFVPAQTVFALADKMQLRDEESPDDEEYIWKRGRRISVTARETDAVSTRWGDLIEWDFEEYDDYGPGLPDDQFAHDEAQRTSFQHFVKSKEKGRRYGFVEEESAPPEAAPMETVKPVKAEMQDFPQAGPRKSASSVSVATDPPAPSNGVQQAVQKASQEKPGPARNSSNSKSRPRRKKAKSQASSGTPNSDVASLLSDVLDRLTTLESKLAQKQ